MELTLELEKNIQEAPTFFVDETVIDHLLSLTIEQRIHAHESARQLAEDLKVAGQQLFARFKETTPTFT